MCQPIFDIYKCLNIRYEYEFPDWYVTPWMFHLNTNLNIGFDEFMDRHRNPKDLEREVLEAKLKHTDPFHPGGVK